MGEGAERIKRHIAALEAFEQEFGEYITGLHNEKTENRPAWPKKEHAERKRRVAELAAPADQAMKASGVGQYAIFNPPMFGGGLKAPDLPSQVFDFGVYGFDYDEFYFQKSILERIPSQLAGLKMKLEEAEEDGDGGRSLAPKTGASTQSLEKAPDPVPDEVPALRAPSHHRVDAEGLPVFLTELIEELNDNLGRGNKNAAALLSRKIIHVAIVNAMQRRDKEDDLKNAEGEEVDLKAALARCSREYGVSHQVQSRVTSAKWIGDGANHSYRLRITQADVDQLVTGLRLFLAELFGPAET